MNEYKDLKLFLITMTALFLVLICCFQYAYAEYVFMPRHGLNTFNGTEYEITQVIINKDTIEVYEKRTTKSDVVYLTYPPTYPPDQIEEYKYVFKYKKDRLELISKQKKILVPHNVQKIQLEYTEEWQDIDKEAK